MIQNFSASTEKTGGLTMADYVNTETIGQIALNVDCMEYMRSIPNNAFDLAIVDPPYFSGPERRGY